MSEVCKITIDTEKVVGKIKPMHAVNNGPLLGGGKIKSEFLADAGIPYVRLHDTGGDYGGHVFVDIANIFRDFSADELDPNSYDFAFTDWLLKSLIDAGSKPFYRLGASIENAHRIKAYNIYPPKDNLKWARICEGIIRHYNEGWANGFHFGIEYWEIWGEPDNEPEIDDNPLWKGTQEQFFELYATAASYLKEKFPSIKIGGYSSCGFYKIADEAVNPDAHVSPRREYFVTFFHNFLEYITDEKHRAPLDFFSWHSYAGVNANLIFTNYARETLDKYGFYNTENICNEWNPNIHIRGTLRDATNILANMLALHKTDLSMLMYYDWRIYCEYCGAINPITFKPFKAYYSFKAFNELYKLQGEISVSSPKENVFVLGARAENTAKVLIVNYTDKDCEVLLDVLGEGFNISSIKLIDEEHTFSDSEKAVKSFALDKDAIALIELNKE